MDATARFTPPVLLERHGAEYPKEAIDLGLEATVLLKFTVDAKGSVVDVTIKTPAGHGFDEAATAAIKQFKFKAAEYDGWPVAAEVTYPFHFVIKREVKKAAPILPAPSEINAGMPPELPIRMRGVVVARGTRAPIPGARVTATLVTPESTQNTSQTAQRFESETGDAGEFILRGLPAGKYTVVVAGGGAERTTFEETLGEGQLLTVKYYVGYPLRRRYQSVVRGTPEREEISRQTLSTEELMKMPGSMGDALRAIENLPGVARAPFNSGLIIVRGGKPTDSQSFMGGAEVPQLYHFGGLTSVVPSAAIESIDLFAGNFGVRYGRAIAGVIDLELREGLKDRYHGYVDVNLFDAGAGAEGPLGKGSFMLSARRSYVDGLIALGSAAGALPALGLGFTTAPVYYDYQAVFDYPLGGGKLRAMIYGSDDQLKLVFDHPQSVDPSIRGAFSTHIFFHDLQVRWTRSSGNWSFLVQTAPGYNGSEGALGDERSFSVTALEDDSRLEARYQWSRNMKLLLGADTQLSYVDLQAAVPAPVREGQQPLPLSAVNIEHANEHIINFSVGLYAELWLRITSKLTVTPGLRFDYFDSIGRVTMNPRLSVRYQLTPITSLKAGIGLYSQDPQPEDYDKSFGNPNLRPENAIHYALGVEQGILPGLLFEATGFYKTLYDLVVTSNQNVLRDGAAQSERTANLGAGRIYGGEFLLRQAVSKWLFGLISYTLMRSERRDCPTCDYRLFDYDQTHVLAIVAHAYLPKGWEVGARFRYVTGNPVTLVRSGTYDADANVYVPGSYPVNAQRLAPFEELDIRIDKTFIFKKWLLKAYVDLTNVLNRANQEQLQYSYDYKQSLPFTGLPFIPSFGVRGEF